MHTLRATYIGHASVLIELDGQAVLTDPVFSHRISLLQRQSPPGMRLEDLPPLSAIVISHIHYDHLNMDSIRRMEPDIPMLMPRRTRDVTWRPGRPVTEIGHWETWSAEGMVITAVPAFHFGGRWMVDGFFRTCNGYIFQKDGRTVYFAGDTARFNDFKAIGERFDIDLALIPIGAYRPDWIMRWNHIGPGGAIRAFKALGAKYMIPIHWGAFILSMEPFHEPPLRLMDIAEKQKLTDRIIVLAPGESWEMESGAG